MRGTRALCAIVALACARAGLVAAVTTPAEAANNIWSNSNVQLAVQTQMLYNDSKTFVDLPLLNDSSLVEADFADLTANGPVSNLDLADFVSEYFGEAGSDLVAIVPADFQNKTSSWLPKVTNATIRQWALDVHDLWNVLSRQEISDVADNPQLHSLLPLPYPVVVPGERYREVYYWDSYWVVRGLLVSGLTETAAGVVGNLIDLLETYGFVPNGARTYYLNRSQPPLLSQMVQAVFEATGNTDFLASALPALLQEHAYWTTAPKLVTVADSSTGAHYNLSRYYAAWTRPRPESYREDVATAEGLEPAAAEQLWRDLATAAESGWDFSTRWLADGANLSSISTTTVIPADLNAYLYQMELNIAAFAAELGNMTIADDFVAIAAARADAMQALMWNDSGSYWRDLVITNTSSDGVSSVDVAGGTYVSNWIPLWAGLLAPNSTEARATVASFAASGLIFPAGIATSLYESGQQWDAPNAWPNLQHIMIEALDQYGGDEGQALGAQLAQTWLNSNFQGYLQEGGKMIEKYDARKAGVSGGGGEYNVQTGFGWTNGVMLDLLDQYGWNDAAPTTNTPTVSTASIG